jgi:hypothetical protein
VKWMARHETSSHLPKCVVKKTYTDNTRVVCKMYVRDRRISRHLSIPGRWWCDAAPEWKNATFDGVVVGREGRMYDVYVLGDGMEYKMRSDAVAAYADDARYIA